MPQFPYSAPILQIPSPNLDILSMYLSSLSQSEPIHFPCSPYKFLYSLRAPLQTASTPVYTCILGRLLFYRLLFSLFIFLNTLTYVVDPSYQVLVSNTSMYHCPHLFACLSIGFDGFSYPKVNSHCFTSEFGMLYLLLVSIL